ncbi:hypothetical protein Trydic_g11134 [Trypoxylus dichotomus]
MTVVPKQLFRLTQQVYGDDCLSRANVYLWHKRFLEDREMLESDNCEGRLISTRTYNRNVSLETMEEDQQKIDRNHLAKTKVCTKFILHRPKGKNACVLVIPQKALQPSEISTTQKRSIKVWNGSRRIHYKSK